MTVYTNTDIHFSPDDLRHKYHRADDKCHAYGVLKIESGGTCATLYFGTPAEIDAVIAELVALKEEMDPPVPQPSACRCSHARTLHAFSGDVCAVPECTCAGYRATDPAPITDSAKWTQSEDGRRWGTVLPDGTLAVIERIADGDENGNGVVFIPQFGAIIGPECGGLLAAVAWVTGQRAGLERDRAEEARELGLSPCCEHCIPDCGARAHLIACTTPGCPSAERETAASVAR